MKTTLKIVFVGVLIALFSTVSAQNIKIAHINMQDLIFAMPEYEKAMEDLRKFGQELENELELLQVEYRRKLDDYLNNSTNLTELVRRSREEELGSMQQRIGMFQQQAQETFELEQHKLMQPVWEKANKAVESVAMAQGITYVITGEPQILIFKAVGTLDLLPAVKQHLGIK